MRTSYVCLQSVWITPSLTSPVELHCQDYHAWIKPVRKKLWSNTLSWFLISLNLKLSSFFSILFDAPTLRLYYSKISTVWNQEENTVGGSAYIVWSADTWSCVKSIRGNCQSIMRLSNQLNLARNIINTMLSNIQFKVNLPWIHRTKLSACWFLAQMPKILL